MVVGTTSLSWVMRLRKTLWFFAFFFLTAYIGVPASSVDAAFQENLWGARPAALAGAFTAVSDDANATAYNPAGISLLTQSELTFMYAKLYSGVNFYAGQNDTSRLGLGFFSYVPKIDDGAYGSYAISWTNFVASNLYREDTFSLSAADSYQFESIGDKPILSYGASLKMLRRSFSTDTRTDQDPVFNGGRSSTALTGDIGLLLQPNFRLFPGLRFGFAGQNVTEPNLGLASTDRVPARYSLGVAYHHSAFPLFNPSVEVSKRHGRTLVAGAWEAWVAPEVLAVRFGGNADEFGGGIGYQFDLFGRLKMKLDYALIWPLNVQGTNGSHRVSITTSF
jgi:hypothetical protein